MEILEILAARIAALNEKNYKEADRLREELSSKAVRIYDVKHPVTSERFTFWQDSEKVHLFPHDVSPEDYALLKSAMKKKK